MKPKHQRLLFVLFSVVFLCAAVLLTMRAFSENLVFFYSPSDMAAKPPAADRLVRVGGLIEAGSLRRGDGQRMEFVVTDGKASLPVRYQGMVPALFREGQGCIAEGYWRQDFFEAVRILTKHDEKYMPKEVADALKRSGHWKQP